MDGDQRSFPGTILDAELEIPEAAAAKNLPISYFNHIPGPAGLCGDISSGKELQSGTGVMLTVSGSKKIHTEREQKGGSDF